MKTRFYLGLDLGQVHDYSALTLTEQIMPEKLAKNASDWRPMPMVTPIATKPEKPVEKSLPTYDLHNLKRWRHTPYPDIVDNVVSIMQEEALAGQCELVVDGTGVGRPVVDLLRQRGIKMLAATITAGNKVSYDAGFTRIPKIELVGIMQVLLQTQRINFASQVPEVQTLVAELKNFKVAFTNAANTTFGAGAAPDWRDGAHDDLVLALALPMWRAEKEANRGTIRRPQAWSGECDFLSGY
jgi:hypothetical protein